MRWIVLALVLVVFASGCVQQGDLGIIKKSDERSKNIDFIIEYNVDTERVIDSETLSQTHKEVIYKSGNNLKIQTIINSSIFQEIIKNDLGVFSCTYFAEDDILCIPIPDSEKPEDIHKTLQTLSETGLIKPTNSQKTINLGKETRKCDNIELLVDKSKLTTENIKTFDSDIPSENAYDSSFFKEMKGSFCFDEETGITLETKTFTNFDFPYLDNIINIKGSIIKTATKLTINPSFNDGEFQLSENAAIEEFPKDSV